MKPKKVLATIFILVLFCMIAVTSWASLYESVFTGARKIAAEPWGIATFADTYFAFLTFYAWVFYKEETLLSKSTWLILILSLGNISMAAYVLWQIYQLPKDAPAHHILLRTVDLKKI